MIPLSLINYHLISAYLIFNIIGEKDIERTLCPPKNVIPGYSDILCGPESFSTGEGHKYTKTPS